MLNPPKPNPAHQLHRFYLIFSALLVLSFLQAGTLHAQERKDIPMAQPDNRFTVFGQRYWSSLAGTEKYFFYVQNNTDEEYTLEINIKLHLSCDGWKSFKLGYGSIRLKPKEMFRPIQGGEYSVLGGDTEAKKGCRMKDGNDFTFLHTATWHMTNVVNVSQQKQADAQRKAEQEAADKKAEEERKRLAEEKRKADELARQQQEEKNKLAAQQKAPAADDFWTGKKPATTTNNSASSIPNYEKLPEFFTTTDGRYFRKNNGELQEISYDGYMGLVHQKAKQQEQTTNKALTSAEQQQLVAKIKADNDAAFNKFFKQFDDVSARFDQYTQARLGGEAIEESKSALNENSTLSGNYQSIEQLQADFDQKMANINRLTNDLTQKRNQQVNLGADMYYSEPQYQSINEGVKLIGSIVNSAKAAKEKKEAQEQLRLQRQLAENRIKAEEKKMITGIRTDLFNQFKEAAFPTSTSKIQAGTLYFFAYAYDPQQIGVKQTTLYISNVFPISKYSDGSWPYKNSIVSQLTPLTPYKEILHGYYGNAAQAEEMRQGMMKVFVQSGGTTKDFSYKGRKASGTVTSGPVDFWENGKKSSTDSLIVKPATDSTKKKAASGSDFWNN